VVDDVMRSTASPPLWSPRWAIDDGIVEDPRCGSEHTRLLLEGPPLG